MVAISGYFTRKSILSYAEYAVANKSLGFFYIFFTYFSTWISGATILSLATMSFKWGLYQYWFMAIIYVVGALSGPLFLTRIREVNVYTVGDFFALRYPEHEKIVRAFVAISMLARNISIIGAQFTTVAFLLSIGFGLDFNYALIFTALFIVTYTALSGIRGVASTDVLQGMIQITGMPLLIFFILKYTGGLHEIFDFYQQIGGASYLNIFSGANKLSEIAVLLIAPGLFFIIEDQTTWQRINSSKSDKVAFWGYLAPLGAALIWTLIPCLMGVFSKVIFPNYTAYPVALLDFIFLLPKPATILILCAIISASVSTCDSYLLSSGVIVSQDVVQKILGVKASEKKMIFFTILGILLTGAVSLYAGFHIYDIFELYMLGAYIGGSILSVPYLLTWFSKRMNGKGLIAGMAFSGTSFFVCTFFFHLSYPCSMIISILINLMVSHFVCSFFKAPSPDVLGKTYYFSPRFSSINNIPK